MHWYLFTAVGAALWGLVLSAHPLDDLTGAEMTRAVEILKAAKRFPESARYPVLALDEPDKEAVRAGRPVPRRAKVAVLASGEKKFWEAFVDLTAGKLAEVRELKGVQPPILLEEYEINAQLVRQDPRWQAAIRKRGHQPEDIAVDSWVPGLLTPKEKASGARLMRGISYYKGKGTNYYARPIEGLIVTVDMNARKVIEVLDTGPVPLAKGDQELRGLKPSPTLKPLEVKRPDGPSYRIDGREIRWENWRFRYSLHPQKGLTLYLVDWRDGDRWRSIGYKLGLSEMVVPYGDPDRTWAFRNAFDLGEYGVGRTAHTLSGGVDAPASATFLDAEFADDSGKPFSIPRAVAVYERETGILWKHQDQNDRNVVDARRNRELVVGFMTVVGNYDYGIQYVFHLDGTLEVEALLTGMMQAKGTTLTKNPCADGCSHLVEPHVIAPSHQHFFTFRLDLDVDGTKNAAAEINTRAIAPKALNPFHNAFDAVQTVLKREKAAARDLNFATARKWKVLNPVVKNALGHPTGYLLFPGENSVPYLKPQSPIRKRAGMIDHHVWFTRYKADEQGAAGEYPNQSSGGDGLPRYIADNEKLENEDVVLWYTFGVTHVARPEEWPIMSVHKAGFRLLPFNFFSANPTVRR